MHNGPLSMNTLKSFSFNVALELATCFLGINLINSFHYLRLFSFSFAEFGYLLFQYLQWSL